MTQDPVTTAADIAFIRDLAEQGRNTAPLNGPFLIAAAVIFGVANLGQWALATGQFDVSPWAALWLWVGAAVVFGLSLAVLIRRQDRKPGANTLVNKAIGASWTAVGFGIFAVWLAFTGIGFKTGDWAMMWAMPSLVFAAYGSAWFVAGEMTGRSWMKAIALMSFAGAAALGLFIGDPAIYLVFTIMLLLVALIPGIVLTRQEPAASV
ncbi:hypothetical protein [Brevundimonas variabilis]|uniref:Uncharacterized protein n=1 Tax=Brevundimonas variabilis TaxID=74312 RepID=A0A7W9CHJ9_9CAUL|nr:hypothetical protein [Brevundimonas variabilis]MBB5745518.1 hypothetical protein [Brevundimonas variabilis]